jgi:hypothetical protein
MNLAITIFLLAFFHGGQAPAPQPPPPAKQEPLTATEKGQLGREAGLDGRVRVYETANARLGREVQGEIQQGNVEPITVRLEAWSDLLEMSLKDIETNANRKRKSRAVIQYEIQIRKCIADMHGVALKAPSECQKQIEDWLGSAERVRKRLVDILFQREGSE